MKYFFILLLFIIIILLYLYYKNISLIRQIPEIIEFYNKLEKINGLGLAVPNGTINCKVLILLNIATTEYTGNVPVYIGPSNTIFTLKIIEESFGYNNELSNLIDNGKISIADIIPIRLPNSNTIDDVPQNIINECVQFTGNILIPKVNPEYVIGLGASSKLLLQYMQSHSKEFVINPQRISNTITIYKIYNIKQQSSFLFIQSFHPSIIIHTCFKDIVNELDDVFNYIRTILDITPFLI